MFTNIRVRLVVLNAAVCFLILLLFSSGLYLHMRYRLYQETDEILLLTRDHILSEKDAAIGLGADDWVIERDDRITFLFWNEKGQLVEQSPDRSFTPEQAALLFTGQDDTGLRTFEVDRIDYRIAVAPAPELRVGTISTVGVVASLQDDQSTLRSLRWDIGAGIAAGVVISLLAGLFLAGRAWVPIRKAWEKQQRFVADASHELRTPTSVIRAQTELLLRRPERTIEQESPNIALMLQESRRMSSLLEDLLTLARSDSNQLELQCETLDVNRLIMEMTEPFKLLAETKEIELVAKLEQPLILRGDADRIRQLFVILLDNALKFTPSSGRIEVAGSFRSNHVALSVHDTGSGIAHEDLPHVFERFYRGDKARSRSEGGTGLGLSIAKWIVEAHQGSIRIESKPGKGTKVEALFPRYN